MPGNLSNQDGSKSFMAQFLNHAEEVDLAGLDLPAVELTFEVGRSNCVHALPPHTQCYRNTRDERYKFLVCSDTYSEMPLLEIAGWL